MYTIDLALTNETLYKGCVIEEVAGRFNLVTSTEEAVSILGKNIVFQLSEVNRREVTSVTLTGPMAVWSYLVVFHAVVHLFKEVWYDDGRNKPILIAKHG